MKTDQPMNVSQDVLDLNPDMRITVEQIGLGNYQIVMADGFYRWPEKILRLALDLPYTNRFEIIGNFPGVRASIPLQADHLTRKISELWGQNLKPFFNPQPVVFSGITNREYRLNIGQRQPHIDQDVTAMVYLNPPESCVGGTGLYRHRLTGLERLPHLPDQTIRNIADRLELSDEFLQSQEGYENFQNSLIFNPLFACPGNTYINEGNEFWELMKFIEMKPNRLIIFDGRCFHSQFIKPEHYTTAFRVNQILYLCQDQPAP